VILLVGCSFRSATAPDGAVVHDVPPDMTTGMEQMPDPGCWPRWHDHSIRFGAIAPLGVSTTTTSDRDPTLVDDEKTLFFQSIHNATGPSQIYMATRSDVTQPFGAPAVPTFLATINANASPTKISFTSDGLQLAVSSDRAGGQGGTDLWLASRATSSDDFGTPTETNIATLDDAVNQFDPNLVTDDILYYAPSQLQGHTMQVIASSTRTSETAIFATPVIEMGLESGTGDGDPAPSPDRTVIAFSSSRDNATELVDVYYAVRDDVTQPWSDVLPIPDVNSTSNEGDPLPSADGCRLYFASDRGRAEFEWTLYSATAQ
jgi:Tol biopolymer transport system component